MSIRVQEQDFDLGTEYQTMIDGDTTTGAVVSFVGRVRDFHQNKDAAGISSMTLEHYPAMTIKELQRIEDEANSRWSLTHSLIIHRFGKLEPGDQIVLVLTASLHRQDAFDAAQFLMDWLKTKAPFWKKEQTSEGSKWVEAKKSDEDAAQKWNK